MSASAPAPSRPSRCARSPCAQAVAVTVADLPSLPLQLRLDTPINSSTTTHADFSIFSAQRDLGFYASCHEATKGTMARLRVRARFF